MTRFYEGCPHCGFNVICICPECDEKDKAIEQLIGVCKGAIEVMFVTLDTATPPGCALIDEAIAYCEVAIENVLEDKS